MTVGFTLDVNAVVVEMVVTCWARIDEMLLRKLPVAANVAVIAVVPMGRPVVEQRATPAATVTLEQMVVSPRLKVTDPVGEAMLGAAPIVAVKVTDWPVTDGFDDDANVVVVGARTMVSPTPGDVAVLNPTSPE